MYFFFQDFFGKVKNGQKKCPISGFAKSSWKNENICCINIFSIWSPKKKFSVCDDKLFLFYIIFAEKGLGILSVTNINSDNDDRQNAQNCRTI